MSKHHTGSIVKPMKNGVAIIGSDAHYWPGKATTAHRAFVKFIKDMQPDVVGLNGDVIDASTISRHPPIGWEYFPTVKAEIEVAKERSTEIADAAKKGAFRFWTLGNHDARFNTRLAEKVPEYKDVKGFKLRDHFPGWVPAWSVELGGTKGIVIKHRFKGGVNAAFNNALWSGRSALTGHLHRLMVRPLSDYNHTRYGVEGGMLADVHGRQFKGYTENNPLDWQSGFVVLTFRDGVLLPPEPVVVVKPGLVAFRAKVYKV